MRYVRGRRLSEAARQLAQGAPDILRLALDAGYSSHEAFTRAFKDQFALTPEQVRAQGYLDNIPIVEAITMNAAPVSELAPPRYETLKPTVFGGLVERHNCEASAGIPDQWPRFAPYLGTIPGRRGHAAYGVVYNFDSEGNFDYMCGVEIAEPANLPPSLVKLSVPAQEYAVFTHRGHVAGIRSTISTIWSKWLPESGYKAVDAPSLEKYGPEFNPVTGMGGFEIWVPIQR
jgi:AraC family transcriptional regulator